MTVETIKNTDLALTAFFYGYALGLEIGNECESEAELFNKGCRVVESVSKLAPYKDIIGNSGSLYAPQVKRIAATLRDRFILYDGPDEKEEYYLYPEKIGALSDEDQQRVAILRAICDAVEKASLE